MQANLNFKVETIQLTDDNKFNDLENVIKFEINQLLKRTNLEKSDIEDKTIQELFDIVFNGTQLQRKQSLKRIIWYFTRMQDNPKLIVNNTYTLYDYTDYLTTDEVHYLFKSENELFGIEQDKCASDIIRAFRNLINK